MERVSSKISWIAAHIWSVVTSSISSTYSRPAAGLLPDRRTPRRPRRCPPGRGSRACRRAATRTCRPNPRFDADDLDLRIQRLGVRGNPAMRPPPPTGTKIASISSPCRWRRISIAMVPWPQSHRGRRRVHEHQAPVAGEDQRVLVRLIVIIACSTISPPRSATALTLMSGVVTGITMSAGMPGCARRGRRLVRGCPRMRR